jgi:hypothetical protein
MLKEWIDIINNKIASEKGSLCFYHVVIHLPYDESKKEETPNIQNWYHTCIFAFSELEAVIKKLNWWCRNKEEKFLNLLSPYFSNIPSPSELNEEEINEHIQDFVNREMTSDSISLHRDRSRNII